MKRKLILEDGSVYVGDAIGGDTFQISEIVFNTGMGGYQEEISDPSYYGQMILMTYPMIGNYGINRDDFESLNPATFGIVVGELCEKPSNWRVAMSLNEFLKQKKIPGIAGVDTRAITKKIRSSGVMKATFADMYADEKNIIKHLKNAQDMGGQVAKQSTQKPYPIPNRGKKVVLVDFGAKQGIVRELSKRGCDLIVVPYNMDSASILAFSPDGIMLSNGPGDPKDVKVAIQTVQELLGKVPIFGICLGHQLLALACGADTMKLRFGHHGCNHPVIDIKTNKVAITSQNHNYAIDENSLKNTDLEITHKNLNDKSIEGITHKKYPAFSIQHHPEASPGPEDANYIFDEFMDMMEKYKEVR
ncbi:MAG: carbamoyl phosphate synthase small subunit [Breznakia sp.]